MDGEQKRQSLRELEALLHERTRRAAGEKVTTGRSYWAHEPTPRQKVFLATETQEALYGGAAGGGKTDALLMAALEYVHVPGYAAIIFRRTYADLNLPNSAMSRSHDWLAGKGVDWSENDRRWTFPSGATLSFGYLDSPRDKYRYASAEFQSINFDELTQFPVDWYLFLFSRLRRTTDMPVPLRMRAASNPGDIGHEWVFRRFIERPEGRIFVPALLTDNPHIDQEEYLRSLAQLDPITRAQLEKGQWIRDSKGLVYKYDAAKNLEQRGPACHRHVLALDYGFADDFAWSVLGWEEGDPTVWVLETGKLSGIIPSAAAAITLDLVEKFDPDKIVGDVGGLGKGYAEETRQRFGIPVEAAKKRNKAAYIKLLNGALANGELKIVQPACGDLIAEYDTLPLDETGTKEADGFPNHCADATLYGWRECKAFAEARPSPKHEPGSEEALAEEERLREEEHIRAAKELDEDPFGYLRAF